MDPLQWLGAVRMRVQTADKKPSLLSTSSAYDSGPSEANILTLQIIVSIAFSSEKSSHMNQERKVEKIMEKWQFIIKSPYWRIFLLQTFSFSCH